MNITEILLTKIENNRALIDNWFKEKFAKTPALFYNSVDLRHNGIKIAPIDTNCFPAGFNNLSKVSKEKAKIIADDFFDKNFSDAKKIIIIPESHTRNLRYLQNIADLTEVISAKREVVIGTLLEEIKEKTAIDLENGGSITLHPVANNSGKITTIDGFIADVIVLNNDLTSGIPEILENCATPIVPSKNMGWHNRTKSAHFDIYNQIAKELAQILDIDPWLISSTHRSCHDVDFKEQTGLKCLAKYVDEIIAELKNKYQKYGIDDEPYCYIKADNGTYGIAVWPVFSGEDVLHINKKERNKMDMLKGSVKTTQIMVQEGIKTIDKIDGKIAEPMIYMINAQVVGNLFRANEARDEKISLNAAGASFFDLENLSNSQLQVGLEKNKISEIYSLIARLAALASAIENYNSSK
ncbi:MAG: glutamate--cysteine ligase [Rickettsiales bacterium]|nr:glutamate--cysteine ligase [Rickettsiales bacterium]